MHPSTDIDLSCFEKATANKEQIFCLRSQDITAPLVIDFWVRVQQKVREHMKAGLTLDQSVKAVRAYYFLEPMVDTQDAKLVQACSIAGAMENWGARRLAD